MSRTRRDDSPAGGPREARRGSQDLQLRVLQALPVHIVVLDPDGRLVAANRAWDELAERNEVGDDPSVGVGANYLDVCRRAAASGDDSALSALQGIEAVMAGRQALFTLEYPCDGPRERRWFSMTVASLSHPGDGGVAISHTDITERKRVEESLRESEERYRFLVEQAVDGIFLADPTGRYLDVNPAGVRMLGYSVQELRERAVTDVIIPEELPRMPGQFARLDSSESVVSSWVFRRKNGSTFTGEVVGRRLPDGRLLGQLRDISARRRAEEALQQLNATLEERVAERTAELGSSEERQRAILDTVVDAIVTIDKGGTIVDVNPATERMFGFGRRELLGQNVSMLMPPPYREEHEGYLRSYHRTGVPQIIGKGREVVAQRKDGTVFPIDLAVSELSDLGLFTGVIHDLTRRKQVEADVLHISERERERAAADLHDGVCQELMGISFQASGMLPDLQAVDPRLAARLRKLAGSIARAAEHTRQVARGMNPMIPAGDGLMDALRQLAETVRQTHRVRCTFQCPEPVLVPEPKVAFQMYRVTQEAIQNAIRHGRATRITIRLTSEAGVLRLVVSNNGSELLLGAAQGEGLGLRTMRYRLGLIGGDLTLARRGRGGVEVRCLVPGAAATS